MCQKYACFIKVPEVFGFHTHTKKHTQIIRIESVRWTCWSPPVGSERTGESQGGWTLSAWLDGHGVDGRRATQRAWAQCPHSPEICQKTLYHELIQLKIRMSITIFIKTERRRNKEISLWNNNRILYISNKENRFRDAFKYSSRRQFDKNYTRNL